MKYCLSALVILSLFLGCQGDDITLQNENVYDRVDSLIEKARNQYSHEPNEAEKHALEGLRLAERELYKEGMKQAHNCLNWIYLGKLKDRDKALFHQAKFQEIAAQLEDDIKLAALNYSKGARLYYEANYTEALPYLFDSYNSYQYNSDHKRAAYVLYAIAKIYRKTAWPEKGVKYLNKADITVLDSAFAANLLELKGMLYFDQEAYTEAIANYEMALAYNGNNPGRRGKILRALSMSLIRTQQFAEAEVVLEEGLAITEQNGDSYLKAELLRNRGFLREKQGLIEEAITWLRKSQPHFMMDNHVEQVATLQVDLSHYYYLLGNIDAAITEAQKGLDMDEVSDKTRIMLYRNLGAYYRALDDKLHAAECDVFRLELEKKVWERNHRAAVLEADLSYRNSVEEREHIREMETFAIAREESKNKRVALYIAASLIAFVILLTLSTHGPLMRHQRATHETHKLFTKFMHEVNRRMEGIGAVFPAAPPKNRPEPPDENDPYGHRKPQ